MISVINSIKRDRVAENRDCENMLSLKSINVHSELNYSMVVLVLCVNLEPLIQSITKG